jgi:predicted metal-dependent phosphoesterase TrpH
MNGTIDLHIHSNRSDGIHSPREVVRLAAEAGLSAMALADHDALDGVDEALDEGEHLGVIVIPAVELSVAHRDHEDVHLLGFHINHRDPLLCATMDYYRSERTRRCERMVQRINERLALRRKLPIDMAEIEALAAGSVGRPHMARVLIAHGYARTMQDAFEQYLIPCNVPKHYLTAAEAIDEIHRTGGVAVLAHPHSITDDNAILAEVVNELVSLGLDGLEAYNNLCDSDEMSRLERLASDHGLIVTGGSDFHGNNDGLEIGLVRGSIRVPDTLLEPLAQRARRTT